MTLSYDNNTLVTAATYAELVDVAERTVKRWLADDELPGAVKDERGRWLIPSGVERVPRTGDVVQLQLRDVEPISYQAPAPTVEALPSFLTLDDAAAILGISRHAIATHRDYFGVVPFGPNGSLVVPLATIKRIRG